MTVAREYSGRSARFICQSISANRFCRRTRTSESHWPSRSCMPQSAEFWPTERDLKRAQAIGSETAAKLFRLNSMKVLRSIWTEGTKVQPNSASVRRR